MQIVHIPKIALFLDFSSLCNFAKKNENYTRFCTTYIFQSTFKKNSEDGGKKLFL